MNRLKQRLSEYLGNLRTELRSLSKEKGSVAVGQVSVAQVLGGMRGIRGLLCETSLVTPDKGLLIRGIPIGELKDKLPEEIFYLLMVGEMPNKEELAECLLMCGQLAEQIQQPASAIPFYQEGLKHASNDPKVNYYLHNNLAYCLNHQAEYEEALRHCEEAMTLDSSRANAYKNQG